MLIKTLSFSPYIKNVTGNVSNTKGGILRMDLRRKKWVTCFVAFCMALSVLTGLGPTGFLLQAATGAGKPIISQEGVTFSFTTPNAYKVYLAGTFNGWNPGPDDKDGNKAVALDKQENDLWQITLSTDEFPMLKNNKNAYKFVTYSEANGQAHWEDDPNHAVYREALVINVSDLSVVKGESLELPGATYYDEANQKEETVEASKIAYTLAAQMNGVSLENGTLSITDDFIGNQVIVKGTYNNVSTDLKINVLSESFSKYVINADGTITFNVIYSGDTLYYVGSLTGWDAQQKVMIKNGNLFTYTTEAAIPPGSYDYKFKPNASNWDNSFNAEGTSDGNSKCFVPGILHQTLTAEVGKSYTLPDEVAILKEDGTTESVSASYSLPASIQNVTLVGKTLNVSSECQETSISIDISAGGHIGTLLVTVSKELYTYKINYVRPNEDYTDWGLWIWEKEKDGATYTFNEGLIAGYNQCSYQTESKEILFIVKKGDWAEKDIATDRTIQMPTGQKEVEVWLVQGDSNIYYTKPDLTAHVKNAFMDSQKDVLVNLSAPLSNLDELTLKDKAGKTIPIKTTHITDTRIKLTITDGTAIDVQSVYTVESPTFKAADVTMRGILDDTQYYYAGDDLGLTYSKEQSTFKLWAPTATDVKLLIYDMPDQEQCIETAMTRLSSGVWCLTVNDDLKGKYYAYAISFADGTTNYVVDPYAKAVSVNGGKTAIIDLEATNPEGFEPDDGPKLTNATDAIVYELHVRDMSSETGNDFDGYEGKYLAFTKAGLKTKDGKPIGIDHLKELGITHVQLQPIYDYATVDEEKIDSYNWGYDPQNYNVPEGSYATDPQDPTCRIIEAKAMIKALHDAGIGVIMDVVYNHTYDITTGPFEKVVPGYYYRSNDNGEYTNGSGCGNEVASERPMVRKFIKDSVKYWAKEYGMDGFRFDLMGLIDTETMKQITKELKEEVNPNIIIYGEPWTGGSSGLASESQTLKGSQKGTDFGVFNDNIRSAIKGDSDNDGAGFATGSTGQEKDIVEGVQGAIHTIATNPTEMVTYVTAHDNLNLWDKILTTMHLDTKDPYGHLDKENLLANESVKRDLLANGIVFTSQGISFMHAGEEMLRTKYGDSNSYKSSDEINQIRWENRDAFSPVFDYYQGLIALRKAHPAFRMATNSEVSKNFEAYIQENNIVAFTLKNYANGDSWKNIVVIYNANNSEQVVSLPNTANWNVVVNDTKAGTSVLQTLENASAVEVAPLSMIVLYDEATSYSPEPTIISLEEENIGMAVNTSKLLKVTVKDQNGATLSNQKVSFTSKNEDVVSVSASGRLTAKAEGTAEVILTCGKAVATLKVQVVDKLIPSDIQITGSKTYVYESKTLQLSALVYDQFKKEMLDAKVKWESSDLSVATVDAYGKITGIREGQATITATAGEVTAQYAVYVKPYETRYVVVEYIRADQDYTDWNLWTWSTGANDGQVDFTTIKDGKAFAYIEIGPDTQSVGFIVRKGTDWSNCKQDITTDRYIYTEVDQTITKVRIYEMVQDIETLKAATAPVINPEEDNITFYYRNNALFKAGTMDTIEKVQIEINNVLYDMIYDSDNERFSYSYKGLEVGNYYYCYHITYKDGSTSFSLDTNNPRVENNKSVITYQKYDLTVTAKTNPSLFNYRESSVLEVTAAAKEDVEIKKIIADLSALGCSNSVSIDPTLKSIALSVNDDITAGIKNIPVKVYDIYGNVYKTEAEVEVTTATKTEDFDWDEAVIYFMLTDRFNNGDSSNDDPLGIGYDKTVSGSYHGGDFKGITQKLDYLKDLGINTIWISPIVDQIGQNIGDSANCYYAYHGYWAKDFEKLNPHFGSLEDLKELIDAAHDKGIKIMVDVVINHAGYGLKEGETGTDPNFPSLADQLRFAGMFRTDGSTDTVTGEVSGLPDFITEDPAIRNTVLSWQTAWIEKCKTDKGNTIDFFRIDTAKHVDKATLQALKIAATKVKPDFKYILEAWYSSSELDAYLNNSLADGVLNFDFKEIAKSFVKGNLESAETALESLNEKGSSSATYGNFLGSHDEDGFLYIIGKDNVGGLKNAITLQATSKGQPVIYYGEELGLSGANNYPQYDNRYDMNWQLATAENDILAHYQKVLNIRKEYSKIFAKGNREKIAGSDAEGFIAFTRAYQNEAVVIAVNQTSESKEITLKVPFKVGSIVKDAYSAQTYTVTKDGMVTAKLPAAKEGGTVVLTGEIQSNSGSSDDTTSSGSSSGGTTPTTKPSEDTNKAPQNIISPEGYIQVGKVQTAEVTKEPITVTVTLTKEELAQISDSRKLGAYYVDASGNLEYVGGKLKGDKISFTVTQTGNYVLMVYEKSFTDIGSTHWAKTYIEVLAARHILQGKTDKQFDGSAAVTRAEMAAMLGRALNLKGTNIQNSFKDVQGDSWYAGYVSELKELGLMTGYNDNSFKPNQKITREEMAVLIARTYNYLMKENSSSEIELEFKDASSIALWAQDSVKETCGLGIINGTPNNSFLPKQTATRAETAKMLFKLLEITEQF